MECAISGQTVVTGHYAMFATDKVEGVERVKRAYALGSPPPVDVWKGTIQTTPVKVEDVAADIAAIGRSGVLTWSPKVIQTATEQIQPVHPVRIPITIPDDLKDYPDLASHVQAQIAQGGATRVVRVIPVEGEGVLRVTATQMIWPPFRGLEIQRNVQA